MAGDHVRMRFVENVCVRSFGAHSTEELEIGGKAATAKLDGPVIFDLPSHEDVAPIPGTPIQRRRPLPILPDTSLDDDPPKLASASEDLVIELAVLE
jgi:hypothetical protein